MRVLDAKLAQVLRELSDEGVKKFVSCQDMIERTFHYNADLHMRGIIESEQLNKLINAVRNEEGLPEYEGFEIFQESDNVGEELLKMNGIQKMRMLTSEIEILAKEILLFRKGKSYVKLLEDRSLEDIKRYEKELEKDVGAKGEIKYEKDSEYGLNYFEKQKILRMLQDKKMVKQLVDKIHPRDFKSYKERFEYLRNNLIYGDIREYHMDNMINMLKQLFGENIQIDLEEFSMVDIAEAFKQREIEENSKKGFWARIKKFFEKRKTNALPAQRPDDQEAKDKAKEFREQQGERIDGEGLGDYILPSGNNQRGEEER